MTSLMRPLKIAFIILIGLACGAALVLAYNVATKKVMIDLPGAAVAAPGAVFADSVDLPARLVIPSIHVDAAVKPVGVDAQGDLQTPGDATHVAWYQYGPRPGMPGSAVIDGHLDTKYVPQAVFYNLDQLKIGDEVDIQAADGKTIIFKVTDKRSYDYNASTTDIFESQSNAPGLNLITCTGDWVPEKKIYNQRLVVFTERVQ